MIASNPNSELLNTPPKSPKIIVLTLDDFPSSKNHKVIESFFKGIWKTGYRVQLNIEKERLQPRCDMLGNPSTDQRNLANYNVPFTIAINSDKIVVKSDNPNEDDIVLKSKW